MIYVLKGKPVPLARPRLSRSRVYDMQCDLKEAHAWELRAQMGPHGLVYKEMPLKLTVTFFMYISQDARYGKNKIEPGSLHYGRPDLSNMVKYVEDVANGLLFIDDALIAEIVAKKVYDLEPRTEFTITHLQEI